MKLTAWIAISILALGGTALAAGREGTPHMPTPGGPIQAIPANQNISGVWWIQRYSGKLIPVGGGELPFTPAGLAKYKENMAGLKDGSVKDEARRICVPDGIPRVLDNPYPFQIVQTPGMVTIAYELNHIVRPLVLDFKLPSDKDLETFPQYSGHSAAHWDGDTLVIESAGFHMNTLIDASGVPHSDALRTVERVRKRDAKTLEIVVSVTDPQIFARPWQARFTYDLHPDLRLMDYNCGDETLRDISKVPGVAEARRAKGLR